MDRQDGHVRQPRRAPASRPGRPRGPPPGRWALRGWTRPAGPRCLPRPGRHRSPRPARGRAPVIRGGSAGHPVEAPRGGRARRPDVHEPGHAGPEVDARAAGGLGSARCAQGRRAEAPSPPRRSRSAASGGRCGDADQSEGRSMVSPGREQGLDCTHRADAQVPMGPPRRTSPRSRRPSGRENSAGPTVLQRHARSPGVPPAAGVSGNFFRGGPRGSCGTVAGCSPDLSPAPAPASSAPRSAGSPATGASTAAAPATPASRTARSTSR